MREVLDDPLQGLAVLLLLLYLCVESVDQMIFIKEDVNDDHIAHESIEPTHATRDSKEEDKGETGDSKTGDKGTTGQAHTVRESGLWNRIKNGWKNLVRNGKTHEETKKLLMDLKALEMSIDQL